MKNTTFFLRWILLAASLAFLAEELVRVCAYVFRQWGILPGLLDGAILYQLGQTLVLVPFLLFLLRPMEAAVRHCFADRARMIMAAGALLSGLAWLNLRWRVLWSWWCLALVLVGLLLPLWARRRALRPSRWQPAVLGMALLAVFAFHLGFSYLTTGYVIAPLPASPPVPAAERDERWRQDLHYLVSELPRLHVNAYHAVSKPAFEAAAAELDRQIPSLSDAQIITGMMSIVALVGDAHTSLRYGGFHQYPLQLRWFKDGLFVVAATPDFRQALGARVTGIGNTSVQDAYQMVSALISHENEGMLLDESPRYLVTPEILQALGILPAGSSGRFTFEDTSGSTFSLDLPQIEGGDTVTSLISIGVSKRASPPQWITPDVSDPLYRQKAEEAFWFQVLTPQKLLYFKYNACTPFGFPAFNTNLWQAVDEGSLENLVIDLRGNGGGANMVLDPFITELKKRPNIDQAGHLFVLIDRGTFSSAVDNATRIRQETHAVLIGEPAGGNVNGYGEVRDFRLRNSGLTVRYSTQYFNLAPGEGEAALVPDQLILPLAADYFAARDPVLEAVLQTIQPEG
jgi:hypothetical protein